MMLIFFGLFLLLCFYNFGINRNKYIDDSYLSLERTQSVKGIFIIIVFFSHFNSYATFTNYYDLKYLEFIQLIGQSMVTLFLFYSGYGIMDSIKRKGMTYVHKIPIKRILGVLVRFDVAVVIYIVMSLILRDGEITVKKVILSLIGWESVGNSNWYIFVILLMYALTFISFEIWGRKSKDNALPVAFVTLLTFVYIISFERLNLRPSYWVNTAICYPLGMIWSLLKTRIAKFFNVSVNYVVSIIACFTISTVLRYGTHVFIDSLIYNAFFALFIVLLSMRLILNNNILRWCGQHLFEIYILQRIPMIICYEIGLFDFNYGISFVVCLLSTIAFSFVYAKALNVLLKRLKIS